MDLNATAPLKADACTVLLRILATSDLHAHLSPWDYYLDRPQNAYGLARVAGLMRIARQEVANCLYFDNGDLIEGSPLAEYAAQPAGHRGPLVHPMVGALNDLGCDAAALGNHEFSYGLPFLRMVMQGAAYPVLSANILGQKGEAAVQDVPLFAPWVMLQRQVTDTAGQARMLQIGVLGLTPQQVLEWDRALLPPDLQARDMVATAAHHVPLIRAAGADLVIVLAHTGMGQAQGSDHAENVGLMIAALPGIDALVLGHEHQVFPPPGAPVLYKGAGQGTPVVMPGAFGSHLGVIDLALVQQGSGWQVRQASSACRAVSARGPRGEAVSLVAADAGVKARARASHQATRRLVARPVGASAVPLHSFFAVAQPNAMQRLIAAAQAAHLTEMIAGTAWQDLPVLSAVAPFKTGGRGGPEYFTDVPAGPLLMRHAADLYHYPNRFAALAVSGAGLRDWLERAATTYARVQAGGQDQPLLNPMFPSTSLEMIYGLTYRIDLSAPASHDAPTGRRLGQASGQAPGQASHHAGRIRDLCYLGRPVTDDMMFALATNSHRFGVMLEGAMGARPEVIADGTGTPASRDVLLRHLARGAQGGAQGGALPAWPGPQAWSFTALPGTSVTLDTAPAALAHLHDIAGFAPEVLGLTAEGFLRFRLHL